MDVENASTVLNNFFQVLLEIEFSKTFEGLFVT